MSIWKYGAGGEWQEIEDLLATDRTDDCAKERELSGFAVSPAINVGDTNGGAFCISVYPRVTREPEIKRSLAFNFLVMLDIGGAVHYVLVMNLPALLDFLRQNVPLSIAIDDWTIRHEEWEAKIEKELAKQ